MASFTPPRPSRSNHHQTVPLPGRPPTICVEPGLTNREIGRSAKGLLPRRFPFADHAELHVSAAASPVSRPATYDSTDNRPNKCIRHALVRDGWIIFVFGDPKYSA